VLCGLEPKPEGRRVLGSDVEGRGKGFELDIAGLSRLFRNNVKIGSRSEARSSLHKSMIETINSTFPHASGLVNYLKSNKMKFQVADAIAHKTQNDTAKRYKVNLWIYDKEIYFLHVHVMGKKCKILIPSLKLVHKWPNVLPEFKLDQEAIKFILRGADVMRPGIINVQECLSKFPFLKKYSPVAVGCKKNPYAFAVGFLQQDAETLRSAKKGVAITNLHYLDDFLWRGSTVP